MMYRTVLLAIMSSALALDAAAQTNWGGEGFSADFAQNGTGAPDENMSGRFFLDREGMRMETMAEGQAVVSIMQFEENQMLMLMPEMKMYMIMPLSMTEEGAGKTLVEKFNGACAEYAVSKKQGSETLNGRDVEKWRCEQSTVGQADADVWYDAELMAPIKVVDDEGSRFELSNIVEGDQPSSLFQPPADFQPMSMQNMMQMKPNN
jgi:outer membrane lipoprotein-sorting protein